MRRMLLPLVAITLSCTNTTTPTPAPAPPPAAVTRSPEAQPYGLTLEEEASILRLEDRREYDKVRAAAWIHHENPLHRARMALALGRISAATFDDANGNGVKDPGETQAGVAELASLVTDPNDLVRVNAAFALGMTNDDAAIEPLLRFAADKDGTVAAEAVEALSKLANTPFLRYETFTEPREREGVRARAIRFLFRFKTDEAAAVAAGALEAPSPAIRQEAAYALARRPLPAAHPQLELLLTDPNPQTRAYAISALGRIGAPESLSKLLEALGDAHPWVRTNAAVAITRIATKDPKSLDRPSLTDDVQRVMTVSGDDDPGVRTAAIDALAWYAPKSDAAKKRLLDIAANGSRWAREVASGAIAKQLDDASLLPADLSGWAKLRVLESGGKVAEAMRTKWLRDDDPLVRENAIGTIPDDAVDTLGTTIQLAISDPDVVVRARAVERFAKTTKVPNKLLILHSAEERGRFDRQNDERVAAIQAISDIDDPTREPFLREKVNDADPVIRRIAADAIEKKLQKPRPQYTPLPVERTQTEYTTIAQWSRQPHTATIHMTRGKIVVHLLGQDAPMTTWNFAQLAGKKYFDESTFMRVVPNFVIQGGDPRNDQEGGPGYAIRDEINLQKYTRGAVGMALSGPDTGGSQFFITHSPQPHLDGGYTIFGRVEEGMSAVVDQTERGDKVETITIDP